MSTMEIKANNAGIYRGLCVFIELDVDYPKNVQAMMRVSENQESTSMHRMKIW